MMRGADQTPTGLLVLRQIRVKIQGKTGDVLVKSNSRLNWDEIKQLLITHIADERSEQNLLRELNYLENNKLSIEACYDDISETHILINGKGKEALKLFIDSGAMNSYLSPELIK